MAGDMQCHVANGGGRVWDLTCWARYKTMLGVGSSLGQFKLGPSLGFVRVRLISFRPGQGPLLLRSFMWQCHVSLGNTC